MELNRVRNRVAEDVFSDYFLPLPLLLSRIVTIVLPFVVRVYT